MFIYTQKHTQSDKQTDRHAGVLYSCDGVKNLTLIQTCAYIIGNIITLISKSESRLSTNLFTVLYFSE